MTPEQFLQELNRNERQLRHALERTIPLKVSVEMEEFSKDNFRQGGFVDNGLTPWKRTLRQSFATGEDAARTPLLSRNRNLMNSVQHRYTPYKATVYNDVEYADIHNNGGRIEVTARMKSFFWAKYYDTHNELYKAFALKPVGSFITIPKRQFIGDSATLRKNIEGIIEAELTRILKI
jgi:phage gpG-like protein